MNRALLALTSKTPDNLRAMPAPLDVTKIRRDRHRVPGAVQGHTRPLPVGPQLAPTCAPLGGTRARGPRAAQAAAQEGTSPRRGPRRVSPARPGSTTPTRARAKQPRAQCAQSASTRGARQALAQAAPRENSRARQELQAATRAPTVTTRPPRGPAPVMPVQRGATRLQRALMLALAALLAATGPPRECRAAQAAPRANIEPLRGSPRPRRARPGHFQPRAHWRAPIAPRASLPLSPARPRAQVVQRASSSQP